MWYFYIFLLTVQNVCSDKTMQYSFSRPEPDQCLGICENANLPILKMNPRERYVCEQGCLHIVRLFDYDEINSNRTKMRCHKICWEVFVRPKEYKLCAEGCDIMFQKAQVFPVEDDSGDEDNNLVLPDPELELSDNEILLSDPSIKSQLEVGFNVDYKIPETHIRTMPISNNNYNNKDGIKKESSSNNNNGDWLDCASRNSGIPRWILLSAILAAIIIALWLSFSAERKDDSDDDDEKLIIEATKDNNNDDDDDDDNYKSHFYWIQEPPPKYTVESEKV